MTMKRRGFLSMLGAVIAAPALPMAATAGQSGTAYAAAIAHAQKFPVISVSGLAKRGGLSVSQAEAMIKELASQDLVKLVGPSRSGSVRAASKILINDPWGLGRTSKPQPKGAGKVDPQQQSLTGPETHKAQQMRVDLDPLMAHLRRLCVDRGMTLSPRCFAGGAL